jgi:uncharacterized cupredoxin-like copper-binding protein
MKKLISIAVFTVLPVLAIASGGHAGGHDEMHKSHGMEGMSHGGHATAGNTGDSAKVSRTLEVTMGDDMRFRPGLIQVKAGETVHINVHNTGKVRHEMVLGSLTELKEHAAMMRAQTTMKHADPNSVSLGAGQRGSIVWQFDKQGTVDFACLLPGHHEAGMAGKILVN